MKIINDIQNLREERKALMLAQKSVGFVPTMGALHEGHISLIRRARDENDIVVLSIFVNPIQFDDESDLEAYPKTFEEDCAKAEAAGVDIIFAPDADEMYSPGRDTVVMPGRLGDHLCGLSRGRGHFIGVCTVVNKLFNIVNPDKAYFGQKDAQQAMIIRRMAEDLDIPVEIILCPIVREKDGLAMSSRNVRIPAGRRGDALRLYRGLCAGRELIRDGERDATAVQTAMMEIILKNNNIDVDYLQIVAPANLEDVDTIDNLVLIAGAIRVGDVRLIDNILVGPDGPWEEK